MASPTLSVVMPVYNGEAYLQEAIASIRGQTYHDFEFLIVDDGSDDRTHEILSRHEVDDPRIRILAQRHSGVVAALNRAVEAASGAYVARIDADDIAKPHRFARQIEALSAYPNAAVVGSDYEVIDPKGVILSRRSMPTDSAKIREILPIRNCIAHPTVIMRRDMVQAAGGYRYAFVGCEDYDLWLRLSEQHDLFNIPEPLLSYRQHPLQMTWHDVEQRAMSELGAQASARHRRTGRNDPADGLDLVTRSFLRDCGVDDPTISREIIGRAVGAAKDALRAGDRRAAKEALDLASRQPHLRYSTRIRCWFMQTRTFI